MFKRQDSPQVLITPAKRVINGAGRGGTPARYLLQESREMGGRRIADGQSLLLREFDPSAQISSNGRQMSNITAARSCHH